MKRRILLFLSLALLACVPTPEEEIVIGKADGALEARIFATAVPVYREETVTSDPVEPVRETPKPIVTEPEKEPTLRESLGVPERVEDRFDGNAVGAHLYIEIDAEADVPNVSRVPVLRGHILREVSTEAERLATLLLGSGPYLHPGSDSGAAARKNMENTQAWIEALEQKPYGALADYDALHTFLQDQLQSSAYIIAHPEEFYSLAPSPFDGSFSKIGESISLGNGTLCFYLSDSGIFRFWTAAPYLTVYGVQYDRKPKTEAERTAATNAEAFGSSLGFAETRLRSINCYDESYRVRYHSETGFDNGCFAVSLLPVYAGIPLYPYTTSQGTDTGMQQAGVHYDADKGQEQISGTVNDGSVCLLQWQYPFLVTDTENENVSLLSFDEIMQIFRRQVFMNQYLDKGFDETIRITTIRFSYMRVKIKDSDEYRLLPVWDFLGYELDDEWDAVASPGELALARSWWDNQSLLTINAIDGSILNRNLGY